ncbi:sulfite exporter TauE/SafE family protein [Vibrio hannami]|uniref:sulfite exporter TauE/SafE family protein n=1 Tax=Vibrio hannami TaxID=2717094 RepID=UPI00240F7524|nr:sulfite exporter TauE/SafE family protein [Vibrio hannami]MDG3088955.1 sulfite exporter TauE/SafE family protein [Vibrio hannami]
MNIELIALLLGLGGIVGCMAGLLGIGGGLIVVPALMYILPLADVSNGIVMQMALATSLSTIILTSGSSAINHIRLGNVSLSIVRWLLPGVILGGFAGSYVAELIPSEFLPKVFGVIVALLALQMILSVRFERVRNVPGNATNLFSGCLIGTISTLAGIGGGSLIVPYLSRFGIEMRKAIGTASLCGSVIAMSGMIGYIFHGSGAEALPKYSLGYVYLPALLAISVTSVLTTRVGAHMTTKLPTKQLKKIFAIFLLFVAGKMLFS